MGILAGLVNQQDQLDVAYNQMSLTSSFLLLGSVSQKIDSRRVSVRAQADNDARGYVRQVRMASERLSRMDIGDLYAKGRRSRGDNRTCGRL
jgi:hypothetical protein